MLMVLTCEVVGPARYGGGFVDVVEWYNEAGSFISLNL